MTIKQIFDEIANESSTNKKMDILRKYKDDEVLKRVLYLANSKRIKFYIKQIPEYTPNTVNPDTLEAVVSERNKNLNHIYERTYTGHKAVRWLVSLFENLSPDDCYILERIIEKDCKIGMGTSNMNKVFPKLIEDTPYMGAKAFEEKLAKAIFTGKGQTGKALSQIKMDGRFNNAIIRGGDVELESRQGEPVILTGAKFLEELAGFKDCVLNGELTIDGISRYESNGIIASLISIGKKTQAGEDTTKEIAAFEKEHMGYQDGLNRIRYTVWDLITIDEYFDAASDAEYHFRLLDLQAHLHYVNPTMVSLIESVPVSSYEEAMGHFQKVLALGFEGTILKSLTGTWKDGKPNWQVKMKLEMDVDLKIVGFNYGTGKNVNVISSLNATSSEDRVFTKPTGINEATMKFITDNQDALLGTIVEVKCCGLSQDSDGNYALLHPVFKGFRDDKTTADSLGSIMEIEAMAKGLTLTVKDA